MIRPPQHPIMYFLVSLECPFGWKVHRDVWTSNGHFINQRQAAVCPCAFSRHCHIFACPGLTHVSRLKSINIISRRMWDKKVEEMRTSHVIHWLPRLCYSPCPPRSMNVYAWHHTQTRMPYYKDGTLIIFRPGVRCILALRGKLRSNRRFLEHESTERSVLELLQTSQPRNNHFGEVQSRISGTIPAGSHPLARCQYSRCGGLQNADWMCSSANAA